VPEHLLYPAKLTFLDQYGEFNEKRGIVHTEVKWFTKTLDEAVVFVDENNVPYSTGYERTVPTPEVENIPTVGKPINAPTVPTPSVSPKQGLEISANIKHPQAAPTPLPAPSPAHIPAPAHRPAPANIPEGPPEIADRYATSAAGMERSDGYGISWTPFSGEEDAVICKPQDQVNSEFRKIARMDFTTVRVYGTICNQVQLALRAASHAGLDLMLGVFDLANVAAETRDLIRQVRGTGAGWGAVDTVAVGNEDVQKGAMSADGVIAAVNVAREMLRAAGFQGPVVHVETHGAILANPQLCSEAAGDYIAANIHPFFNPGTMSWNAGKYVKSQVRALQECSARHSRKRSEHRVVVAETGWPTNGWPNGLAIPGRSQQFAAIKSIRRELPDDVYLFSAFDNRWQRDSAGTFGAEKHWGLLMD
jgi:exo-beta-1,3-glucanase (GH17 family)